MYVYCTFGEIGTNDRASGKLQIKYKTINWNGRKVCTTTFGESGAPDRASGKYINEVTTEMKKRKNTIFRKSVL